MLTITSFDILSVIMTLGPFIMALFPVYVLFMFIVLTKDEDKPQAISDMKGDEKQVWHKAA